MVVASTLIFDPFTDKPETKHLLGKDATPAWTRGQITFTRFSFVNVLFTMKISE